jgi:hypothetical protein
VSTVDVAGVVVAVVVVAVVDATVVLGVVVVRVVVVVVVEFVVVAVVVAVLHDVVTSKRAIKPVVSSIRQRILFGDKFFKSSPFLSYAC